jgi:Tol biopolymer transport system component
MWVDRNGTVTPIRQEQRIVGNIRISPNGRSAVFHDEQGGLWILDLERGTVELLLSSEGSAEGPIWHPDGRHVTFGFKPAGSWDLYEIDVTTRSEPALLVDREYDQFAGSWSGDGQLLAFAEQHPSTGADIWVVPLGEDPTPVLRTTANEFSPVLSSGGELLAYVSDGTGRAEVYVRSQKTGEIKQVSADGGREPVWSKRGSELFFRRADQLLAAVLTTDQEINVSTPTPVFEMPFERSMIGQHTFTGAAYDVSPAGDNFLVVSERATREFRVVSNWFEEVTERVPIP